VDDVEPASRPVRVATAIGRVDEEVVAGRRLRHRAGVLGYHVDAHTGEVQLQPLPEPTRVNGLVCDEHHVVLGSEGRRDAGGELLAATARRPVAVVDGDLHSAIPMTVIAG
jgi:hypothetical protein